MANIYTPFPLNVTLSSPLIQLAPLASNSSAGWAPSCTSSACASTATWSTGVANSTLSFDFWGRDVVFDGSVQGDMSIKLLLNGREMAFNPLPNGPLFSIHSLAFEFRHSVSLSVLNASSGSLLSVNQARINGSTLTDRMYDWHELKLDSDDASFSYTGFVQEMSPAGSPSPTNYVSSSAGDSASLRFNGSALAIFGPCGPSNGLMRATLDGEQTTVNTSKPIQADDCLLFLSKGIQSSMMHELVITNEDGRQLVINRIQLIFFSNWGSKHDRDDAGMIIGILAGAIVFFAVLVLVLSMRSKESRQKMSRSFAMLCG